ncbi:MAG TPA: 50S ribosomal protein L19 [Fimbriimonadaceae bacterium]|nr:50S ribosomal protein L19 [Fimbriimonadaceae bacterium]
MSKQAIVTSIAEPCLKSELPDFRPGDTVRAHVKVREGGKERIQIFEGTCIAVKNGGVAKTILLRKMSNGVGVERSFPVHSPNFAKFEIVRRGRVRRAKLFYLRDKVGKEARIREKR